MTFPVRFDGLTKYYGPNKVLDQLTLDVPEGSIFALLGRNGAGKTTALKCLLGLLRPTRGRALLLGHEAGAMPPEVRERIGYVAEGHKLVPWMRVERLVAFQAATVPSFDADLCRRQLKELGLPTRNRVRGLSRGQRAQVALALVMSQRPDLAILDDPALGLDTVVRREFLEVMIDLIQEEGRTVLFTSHILGDVERVADRVAIVTDGVLRVCAPLDVVKERIRRFRAFFEGDAPRVDPFDGMVRAVRRRNALLVTVAHGAEAVPDRLKGLGALEVEDDPLSLEDLFVEYTSATQGNGVTESTRAHSDS